MRLMESVVVTKCIKQDFCEGECTQKNLIQVCALCTLSSDRKSSSFYVNDSSTSEIVHGTQTLGCVKPVCYLL